MWALGLQGWSTRSAINHTPVPLRCRYIDLVPDKLKGPPEYYLINAWNLSFRTLVDTLRSYFAACKRVGFRKKERKISATRR